MISLMEKIIKIYPELTEDDFAPLSGTIIIQNDLDGNGEYIKHWSNIKNQPTQSELDLIIG